METIKEHKRHRRNDKLKSALITALISSAAFALMYSYRIEIEVPQAQKLTATVASSETAVSETPVQESIPEMQDIYLPEELKNPLPETPVEVTAVAAETEKPKEKKSQKAALVSTEKASTENVKKKKTAEPIKEKTKKAETSSPKKSENKIPTKTAQENEASSKSGTQKEPATSVKKKETKTSEKTPAESSKKKKSTEKATTR